MPRFFLLISLLSWSLAAEWAVYSGPMALGPFRVNEYDFPLQRLFDLLGQPVAPNASYLCYESPETSTFVWLSTLAQSHKKVGSVFVSRFPNCIGQPKRAAKIDPKEWRTEKGVGLGSTTDELLAAYGKPSRAEKFAGRSFRWVIAGDDLSKSRPELGQSVWVYAGAEDDLRTAEFGIRNGKVAWILLTHNE